jgi:hypothetical protein
MFPQQQAIIYDAVNMRMPRILEQRAIIHVTRN